MSDQFLFAIMIFVGLGTLWIYGAHLDSVVKEAEEAEKLKAKKEQEELNNEEVEEIERVNND